MKKYYIIYKTTNIITNQYYVGMHSTDNLLDGYMGSGKLLKRSLKAFGKQNHRCEIIEFCENFKAMSDREREIVNEDLICDQLCLNLVRGGEGGNKIIWNAQNRKRQSDTLSTIVRHKEWGQNIGKRQLGRPRSVETKKKLSIANKGKKQTEETIEKRMRKLRGRSLYVWKLQTPESEIIEINSLKDFCIQNNLSYNSIFGSLVKGRISRGPSRGWQLVEKSQIL